MTRNVLTETRCHLKTLTQRIHDQMSLLRRSVIIHHKFKLKPYFSLLTMSCFHQNQLSLVVMARQQHTKAVLISSCLLRLSMGLILLTPHART